MDTINAVFTPTPDEVAAARRAIERLDHADSGLAVDTDGRLLDPAVVRTAREVLSRASGS
ncbi:hypothetical protein [Amycolatopsis marina]|uniref:hypothetical protein n=1 Tax=Amycolatopsis marina TaxID=490629 RepID=UPI001C4313E0|nr:hypothetical protein [Amycolatopsis marina]